MRYTRLWPASMLLLIYFAPGFVRTGAAQQETEIEFLIRAAEQGDARSQTELAQNYALGRGVPRNAAEALKWYQKAADQGDFTAQMALGSIYSAGLDVRPDYVLAYMWFDLAAGAVTGGGKNAAREDRDKIAKKMTPEQISEAQRLVREWKSARGQAAPETPGDVTSPVPLRQPLPFLTEEAKKAGIKGGEVILQCVVRKNGKVDSCKPVTKLGYGLDEAAIKTVTTRWLFKPATLRGKPGDAKVMISISISQFQK